MNEGRHCQRLYVIHKDTFLRQYKIRRAVVEDNDDLNPLIEAFYPKMRDIYGEFYIAELLTTFKDSNRQIVVAEYEGNAVAMLCLSNSINYQVINNTEPLNTSVTKNN